MTNSQNPKFQELVAELREIFQIDRPELNFGIYRVLNARAKEINDYLQNRLVEKVQVSLSAGIEASSQQWQAELQEAEKNAQALGVSPDAVPKVQELRAKLKETQEGNREHENAVFSHLLTFFSLYYQDGDFIGQRRYKGDTYAIPYAGEEVVLHWANKDQYYTKSGESFSNYRFKLDDSRSVFFRLVAADTAKDNRKDNNTDRLFALIGERTVTRVDEDGKEYEEELLPVEEVTAADGSTELVIRFEYASQPKGTKQEALVTRAVESVLADAAVKARWLALRKRVPTKNNPQRTLLEKHLSTYTTKKTADYFIHKDLGGFLRRELDFYIKNEIMHLDDVQTAGAFADIEKNLRMIQCLRSIALDLITFLAQMEDFQKKLWLKKKFVVSSHYCITLDRVPEALWPEVVANEQQWAQWKQLGVWDGDAPQTMEGLQAAPYRMVDTAVFTDDFKRKLIAGIDHLDTQMNGLLIHGDNFQALSLIRERYRQEVKCTYIDPPYNTGKDGFVYKDGFKSSSWASLIASLLERESPLLADENARFISLDGNQLSEAMQILRGENRRLHGILTWRRTRTGGHLSKSFNQLSDYVLVSTGHNNPRLFGGLADSAESQPLTKGTNKEKTLVIPAGRLEFFDVSDGMVEKGHSGGVRALNTIHVKNGRNANEAVLCGNFIWVQEKLNSELARGARVIIKKVSNFNPRFMREPDGCKPFPSLADGSFSVGTNEDASALLVDQMGFSPTCVTYPKPVDLCERLVWAKAFFDNEALILDYFAGTGTTAHAVISVNRKYRAHCKYVLVEQGEYFETVLKPRIQKVVFSADWVGGEPTSPETGISHCFKVLKLESYEDTLNNLKRRTREQSDLWKTLSQEARDDYLLHYMLDVENRGSLLSVEDFKKPFDYTLNIALDSAGAFERRSIDLVETFNYLIGLRVKHINMQIERGFVTVTGTLPNGETCLVLWRDCEKLDYEGIAKLCDKLAINPADNEFDVVYINGDHDIPAVLTQTTEEGGATRVLKLRQIEPEFLEHMFSVEDI